MHIAAAIAFAVENEHHGNAALETLPFGLIAAGVFTALGLVTLSYRNVANRHSNRVEAVAPAHGDDSESAHGH